ncbi:MAG: hypothetical protein M1608_12530 [Candidatus Omnitrophica bacterium]|nr:hypothetical protein [Candidatus Omnitrophota bacterium]
MATAVAQTVYSVNVVGYVTVTLQPGFNMVANPLNAATNTVAAVLTGVPEGTTVYKFNSDTGAFSINAFSFGEWAVPDQSFAPGEGAFINVPGTAPVTVTFVGEVMQGDLSTPIPAGFSIKSSQVPQELPLTTDATHTQSLNFPAAEGDTIYTWDTSTKSYGIHSFAFGEWNVNPIPKLGEAFFVKKAAAANWTRTFTVD